LHATSGTTAFHALHHAGTPLLLPNAWDYASAAALAQAGFAAVGTTTLGVAGDPVPVGEAVGGRDHTLSSSSPAGTPSRS
jgi:2-methylisocitrate lyase-like PEP mutase family enzyme